MKLHVENLHQELDDLLKEHSRQIETNSSRHEMSTQELSAQYKQKLARVVKESDDRHEQIVEEIHSQYAVKIADLKRTHEAQLERTAQDVEATYTDVTAELKSSHASIVEDYRLQIAELRREIRDMHEDTGRQNDSCFAELKSELTLARDTISRLEGQIYEFSEHENQLNAELEETKLDRDRRVSEQDAVARTLRSEIKSLNTSEECLRMQLDETNSRWQKRLAELERENSAAIESLSSRLKTNQSEMTNIVTDLERARQQLAETNSGLEERSVVLEETQRRLTAVNKELSQSRSNEEQLTLRVEQADADCLMLVEKVSSYEQQIISIGADDGNTTEELMRRISELEQNLRTKDRAICDFEKRVNDFGEQIGRETQETRERSQVVEQLLLDNQRLLHEKEALAAKQSATIADLEQRLLNMQNTIDDKNAEISEAEARMLWAQANFDSQTESLKTRLKEHEEYLAKAYPDHEQRLNKVQQDFDRERSALEEKTKFLQETLDAERENLHIFKDSVRKQFEERKQQVCMPVLSNNCLYSVLLCCCLGCLAEARASVL